MKAKKRVTHGPLIIFATIFLALLITVTIGCGKKKEKAAKVGPEQAEPRTLSIKGSDTMLPLLTTLAEAYQRLHPDTSISVTDGGSSVGIADLIGGKVDLCMSSRAVSDEETRKADFHRIALQDVIVALDGVTIIVNPQNRIAEISIRELGRIYSGEIKNWRELGGPNQVIQVISRSQDSGTSAFFKERVLQKKGYKSDVQIAASNQDVVQFVAREPWSIGYVGYAYGQDRSVKMIGLRGARGAAVFPTYVTIRTGIYPLERPLHIYTTNKVSSLALNFLEFVFSPQAQQIARDKGYVPG